MRSKVLEECLRESAILRLILEPNLLHFRSKPTRPALRDLGWKAICMAMMLKAFVKPLHRAYWNLFDPCNPFQFRVGFVYDGQLFFNAFPGCYVNTLNHFDIHPLNRQKKTVVTRRDVWTLRLCQCLCLAAVVAVAVTQHPKWQNFRNPVGRRFLARNFARELT